MKRRKNLTWSEFMALSDEEQREYLKATSLKEINQKEKYDPHQNAITVYGDIDEYMKSLGGILLEDFEKKIGEKLAAIDEDLGVEAPQESITNSSIDEDHRSVKGARKKGSEMTYEEMKEYLKNAPPINEKDEESCKFKIEGDVDSFMKSRGSISWEEAQARIDEKIATAEESHKNTTNNEEELGLNITRVPGSIEDYIKARGLTQWEEALARIEARRGVPANKPFDEAPPKPTTRLFTKKGRLNVRRIKKLSDEELRKEMRAWIEDELVKWERTHGKDKMDEFLTMLRQKASKWWG